MNKSNDIIEVIKLYKENNIYKNKSNKELAQHIIPSISLNQYKIFRYENTGVAYGFTNWSFLNKEVENSFKQTGHLSKFGWNSGKNCWHIDTLSNSYNKLKDIYKWTINNLSNYLLDDDYINWIRLNKKGNKVKRINRMTLKEGKRKFIGKVI